MLLCDKDVAQTLSVSRRKIWAMHAVGAIPEPVRMGRAVRWRSADIELWVRLGCPNRDRFGAAKELAVGGRVDA